MIVKKLGLIATCTLATRPTGTLAWYITGETYVLGANLGHFGFFQNLASTAAIQKVINTIPNSLLTQIQNVALTDSPLRTPQSPLLYIHTRYTICSKTSRTLFPNRYVLPLWKNWAAARLINRIFPTLRIGTHMVLMRISGLLIQAAADCATHKMGSTLK